MTPKQYLLKISCNSNPDQFNLCCHEKIIYSVKLKLIYDMLHDYELSKCSHLSSKSIEGDAIYMHRRLNK